MKTVSVELKKKPDERVEYGIAIINPYGGIWTGEIFDDVAKAQAYLKNYWKGQEKPEIEKFSFAPAIQTTKIVPVEEKFVALKVEE